MGGILWSCLENVFKLAAFVFFQEKKILIESPHRESVSESVVISAPGKTFSTVGVKLNS